jgi:lysozyme family protein
VSVDAILNDILRREGGFVDHPDDRGGPTFRGITQGTLSAWRQRPVTVDELKALTVEEAKAIYRQAYVVDPGYDLIGSQTLLGLVVDCAVNHGVKQATKLLQRAIDVKDDGIMGSVTRAKLAACNYSRVYLRLCAQRVRLYGRIITRNPSQAVFAEGWSNRVADFIEVA